MLNAIAKRQLRDIGHQRRCPDKNTWTEVHPDTYSEDSDEERKALCAHRHAQRTPSSQQTYTSRWPTPHQKKSRITLLSNDLGKEKTTATKRLALYPLFQSLTHSLNHSLEYDHELKRPNNNILYLYTRFFTQEELGKGGDSIAFKNGERRKKGGDEHCIISKLLFVSHGSRERMAEMEEKSRREKYTHIPETESRGQVDEKC